MPYKDIISGIYSITSPTGKKYYGSSINIYNRWSQHRGNLRKGNHHSKNLQNEYNLYPNDMIFEIVEVCERKYFNLREQYYIDNCKNCLNTALFITNVWVTPSTREKFQKIHNSTEWKKERSIIASRPRNGWIKVDCSNGKQYRSYSEAAKEFNTNSSHIFYLCNTQKIGKLGFKFKRASDQWILIFPARTRKPHSMETRSLMKKNRAYWRPSENALVKAIQVSSKPMIGTEIKTGKVLNFSSQKDAANFVSPGNKSAASQINRAANGGRKHAFGYKWSYSDKVNKTS